MAPAIAMSPPAPPIFRRNLVDKVMTALRFSQPTMMILRSLVRWPVRSALSMLGLSLAAAVLVASSFFTDALDELMEVSFHQTNRQDAILSFSRDIPEAALASVLGLPGVLSAEGQLYQSAVLRNRHHEKEIAITASRPGADLTRIMDADGNIVKVPREGMLLSDRLAKTLRLQLGDQFEVELKGGRNEIFTTHVSGIVTQHFGLGAYMDLETLSRVLRQSTRISAANVLLDPQYRRELHLSLKELPELSSLTMISKIRRSFEDTIKQNIAVMTMIYVVVAVLITFGVTYNGVRIQLSERARELASLRILGFSRGEVSFILMGETMFLAVLAQPIGWLLGAGIATALSKGSTSDLYAIPLVLEPAGFARASLIVLVASFVSSLIVRRRLDHLDLVRVMKTRE